jgi:hypothetical protein
MGIGAVSRNNLSRSQISVMVQDLTWELMREFGFFDNYIFVSVAGAKAKTVTNNLPILSVLAQDGLSVQDLNLANRKVIFQINPFDEIDSIQSLQ